MRRGKGGKFERALAWVYMGCAVHCSGVQWQIVYFAWLSKRITVGHTVPMDKA